MFRSPEGQPRTRRFYLSFERLSLALSRGLGPPLAGSRGGVSATVPGAVPAVINRCLPAPMPLPKGPYRVMLYS